MSQLWSDLLKEGSYKGVKFDFVSAREQGGNILDVQEYPGRNGAFVEKRSRKALRFEVMAVFIEDDYPDTMFALLDKLIDGTPGELVHPVFGSIQAAAESYTTSHDAEEADTGSIQITFVEHTPNADKVFAPRDTLAGKANETRGNADDVNVNSAAHTEQVLNDIANGASLAVAYASMAYASAVNTAFLCTEAATAAANAADEIELSADEMTTVEIQSLANGALSQIDTAVRALADYTTEEAYNLSRSLLLMAASLDDLAGIVLNAKPQLIAVMVEADIPLLLWAHARYGDSSRADELMTLNDFPDPVLIPAGMLVRCYAL